MSTSVPTYVLDLARQLKAFAATGHPVARHLGEYNLQVVDYLVPSLSSKTVVYPPNWTQERAFRSSVTLFESHIDALGPGLLGESDDEDNVLPEQVTQRRKSRRVSKAVTTEPSLPSIETETSYPTPSETQGPTQAPVSHSPNMSDAGQAPGSAQGGAPLFTVEQVNDIVDQALRRAGYNLGTPVPPNRPSSSDGSSSENVRVENVGFYNPEADDKELHGKHIMYNDVYAFTDRLLMFAKDFSDVKVLRVAPACLRGPALEWHSMELTSVEREFYAISPAKRFCEALIKRFKMPTSIALQALQSERFLLSDLRAGKTMRGHAQRMLRFSKAADVPVHMQLLSIWNSLDAQMQLHVPEPDCDTTLGSFLMTLDTKEKIFQNLNTQRSLKAKPTNEGKSVSFERLPSRSSIRGGRSFGGRGGGGYTGGVNREPANYQQTSYQFKGPPYGTPQYQPPNGNYNRTPLPPSTRPLAITAPPNGSGSRYQPPNREPFQQKAYVSDAAGDDYNDGYGIEDIDYNELDPETPMDDESQDEPVMHLQHSSRSPKPLPAIIRSCRSCDASFASGNKLFKHIRREHSTESAYVSTRASKRQGQTLQSIPEPIAPSTVSSANATAGSIETPIERQSNAPPTGIGSGFGYRGHVYATVAVSLSPSAEPEKICADTGCTVTLIDDEFLQRQSPETPIRTMATPVTVAGFGGNKHDTDRYAIVTMRFAGTYNGSPAVAIITREVHIVKGLKANMLMGMDVMVPERMDPILSKGTLTIGSCEVDVPIIVKTRGSSSHQIIRTRGTTQVPPQTAMLVAIQPPTGDFDLLFTPCARDHVSLFASVINSSVDRMLVRNDTAFPVSIKHNERLGTTEAITEFGLLAETFDLTQESAYSLAESVPRVPIPNQEKRASFSNNHAANQRKLPSGITIYGADEATIELLAKVTNDFADIWFDDGTCVDLPPDQWMTIPLRSDWESRMPAKGCKVYPLGTEDQKVVDTSFNQLHRQGRMYWTIRGTQFSFPVFVVWKIENGVRKGRAIVDIRPLNHLASLDVYPLPLQSDITAAVAGASFITVVDCTSFFHQWRVALEDRHKLTVVSHRGQESFNVAVTGFKNSPAYVQRQMDTILRPLPFTRAYIDDIVIFSKTLNDHLHHLRTLFGLCQQRHISLKPTKAFLGFPTVRLLGQYVDSLGLSTSEEKLSAIAKIQFPKNLKDLERYLGLTGWLRQYVPSYAAVVQPLQERKTLLLKSGPHKGKARKSYSQKTSLDDITPAEQASFNELQTILRNPSFLVHFDRTRPMAIDLDASKAFGFGAVLYHVKSPIGSDYPKRQDIEPILFLSKLLSPAEQNYWPTELEVAGIVWTLRKCRHMIESCQHQTIIFTDHGAALGISQQKSLITSSAERSNLRLVRASEYIQRFNVALRHKPGKLHIVPDALSRLPQRNDDSSIRSAELDFEEAYFSNSVETCNYSTTCAEFSNEFRTQLLQGYLEDPVYIGIMDVIVQNDKLLENAAALPFVHEDGLLWHIGPLGHRRLCIPKNLTKEVLGLAHTSIHLGMDRMFARANQSWYIRGLSKRVHDFVDHCPECLVNQTRRHKPYGSLQPIQPIPSPFHTLTIDFILALPVSIEGFDCVLVVTCKFSKRITAIAGKATWTAEEWSDALLLRLQLIDWGIPKHIISDRDPKFVSQFWKQLFLRLGTRLLYSTAWHPQTDGQSERTNQTFEIALRFLFTSMGHDEIATWPNLLVQITSILNNSPSSSSRKSPNEVVYGFTPNLITESEPQLSLSSIRKEVVDSLDLAAMSDKRYYDRKHTAMFFAVGDKALIRLHRGYKIPAAKSKKLDQQFVGPFNVIERIGRLAYRLDIPSHWRIHPVFTVAQLEPVPKGEDPFNRPVPDHPDTVFVDGDTATEKSFELDRILDKRTVPKGRGFSTQYLIRWKGYGPEFDQWYPATKLGNATELIQEFERRLI